jgi:predicted amidophosphoribosyltransferase
MVESDDDNKVGDGKDVPVCLKCMEPISGTEDFCPNCGARANELTNCMPYLEMHGKSKSIFGRCWKGLRGLFGRVFGGDDGDMR